MGKTIILKGTFQSFLKNKYGLFVLNFKGNNLTECKVVSGVNSKLSDAILTRNWLDIIDDLEEKKQAEGVNTWFTAELKKHIEKFLKNEKEENRNKLINILINNQRKDLSRFFTRIFQDVVADKNINFEFNIEEKTNEEIEAELDEKLNKTSEKKRIELENKWKQQFKLGNEAKFAPMALELAPVTGINITEVNHGDKIYVKLDPTGKDAEFFSKLLNAESSGEEIPIPATVLSNEKLPNDVQEIVVDLGNKIFSIIYESEEDVKVKPYDESSEEKSKLKKDNKKDKQEEHVMIEKTIPGGNLEEELKKDSKSFFFTISLLAIILMVLIILFILYGTKS